MPVVTLKKEILPPNVLSICLRLKRVGARPIIVGGWVRDYQMWWLSEKTKDIDIEVFHISFERLLYLFQEEPLEAFPHFGILRLGNTDLSLPRVERCTGPKYNDFRVKICPDLSFKRASLRRDFTVNAVGWDPFSEMFLDPFHGIDDIKKKLLKPISMAFMEDSYRILRAVQFIARFNFKPDQQLLDFGMRMSYEKLSRKHVLNTKGILEFAPHKEEAFQFLQKIRWQPVIDRLRG